MQAVVVLCLMGLVVAGFAAPQKYSAKFDNIKIDDILKNERVVTQYVKCLLDEGPCSPEGREFRKHLPDALATNCADCTDAQKVIIKKASKHIITKRPADWVKIQKKYDPKGEKHETFQKFIQSA